MAKPLILLVVVCSVFLISHKSLAANSSEPASMADQPYVSGYREMSKVNRFDQIMINEASQFDQNIMTRNVTKEIQALEAQGITINPAPVNMETGPLRVRKSFRVDTLYDTNIFTTRNDPKDELLFLYQPSLGFELGREGETRAFLSTFYNIAYADYAKDHNPDHLNQEHTVTMGLRGKKVAIRLSNQFQPNTAFQTDLFTGNLQQVVAYSDNADATLTYHWTPKIDLAATYNYSVFYLPVLSGGGDTVLDQGNKALQGLSYQQNGISPKITYEMNAKNTLNFDSSFSVSDYFQGAGYSAKTYKVSGGFLHRLTSQTDISGGLGYTWKDYLLPIYPTLKGETWNIELWHQLAPKTDVRLKVEYAVKDDLLPIFSASTTTASSTTPLASTTWTAIARHEFSPKLVLTLTAGEGTNSTFDFTRFDSNTNILTAVSDNYGADLRWFMTPRMSVDGYMNVTLNSGDKLSTFVDPDNPTLSFTRTLEQQIYRWGFAWRWQRGPVWSYYLTYQSFTEQASFKNLEYDDEKLSGSVMMVF